MTGLASGGQTLTPNRNVTARAGFGGDLWGANGGGITPIGGGVSGEHGYDKTARVTQSDGETGTDLLISGSTLLSQLSTGAIDELTPDGQIGIAIYDEATKLVLDEQSQIVTSG